MSKDPILFLPGFMCDQRLFAAQFAQLGKLGMECIAGDISHGNNIHSLAEDLLKQAPEHFALVGLSMGGIVALEMIRQTPERISHLALLNSTANADRSQAQRKVQLDRVAAGQLDMVISEELKPQYLASENRTPEILNVLTQMARDLGKDVFIRQSAALLSRRSYWDTLPDIKCPTLVLTGMEDKVCGPEIHVELAEAIPGAFLKIVPNCGHLSALEQPDIVTAALFDLVRKNTDKALDPPTSEHVRNTHRG